MGKLLPYQDILTTFASPIIMLFWGGFFLAMAATKYHLDVNLARVFLRPFGESPKFVMLGMMIITAVFFDVHEQYGDHSFDDHDCNSCSPTVSK